MSTRLLIGDCRGILPTLPEQSVHCVVTSPPYWGLRDYGTGTWQGGDPACEHRSPTMRNGRNEDRAMLAGSAATNSAQLILAHKTGCGKCGAVKIDAQLGLEPDFNAYVASMVAVFREVRRVLRDDGTLWLNLGDSYATSVNGRSAADTKLLGNDDRTFRDKPFSTVGGVLKPKDICGIPWRVAFALQADGWYLRQDIIWSKPNPMPESVTDRCTKAHEYLFLLSKRERYYYDQEAIAEPAVPQDRTGTVGYATPKHVETFEQGRRYRGGGDKSTLNAANGSTRNRRSVWEVTTQPFSEAHFATFPPALIEPCIKAGTSEKGCCSQCGKPWVRQTSHSYIDKGKGIIGGKKGCDPSNGWTGYPSVSKQTETIGWSPSCVCNAEVVPCTILDPFAGAGTTGLVADRLQRNAILIELNPAYADMSERRIVDDAPLFTEVSMSAPVGAR